LKQFSHGRSLIANRPLNLVGSSNRHDNDQVRTLYDRHARHIDAFFGRLTENSPYRRKVIARLNVALNSSVLDIACGIGSNFKIIESYLQNSGALVGIDISSESLKIAKRLVVKHKWSNVHLLNTSITEYRPKKRFDAILCTFALEIIPEFEAAIDNIFELLTPGGWFAMLGMKKSSIAPYSGLNTIAEWVLRRTCIDLNRDLVRSIKSSAQVHSYEECFLGFYYILSACRQNSHPMDPQG
jgi:ubiquinone/menaquinone biosynthesis C-methylase UbiE